MVVWACKQMRDCAGVHSMSLRVRVKGKKQRLLTSVHVQEQSAYLHEEFSV